METAPSGPSANSGRETVLVDLALQGGGSHGAFTWGVLDRLLEESWLRIDGISGTSAGAMNAVVLVDGYEKGGPEGARAALEEFWRRVSHSARFSPIRRSPMDVLMGRWTLDNSPFFVAFDLAARVAIRPVQPDPAEPDGCSPRPVESGQLAILPCFRPGRARVLALRPEPQRRQPVTRYIGRMR